MNRTENRFYRSKENDMGAEEKHGKIIIKRESGGKISQTVGELTRGTEFDSDEVGGWTAGNVMSAPGDTISLFRIAKLKGHNHWMTFLWDEEEKVARKWDGAALCGDISKFLPSKKWSEEGLLEVRIFRSQTFALGAGYEPIAMYIPLEEGSVPIMQAINSGIYYDQELPGTICGFLWRWIKSNCRQQNYCIIAIKKVIKYVPLSFVIDVNIPEGEVSLETRASLFDVVRDHIKDLHPSSAIIRTRMGRTDKITKE